MCTTANGINQVRQWIILLIALAGVLYGSVLTAQELPYQAKVLSDDTVVRADIGEIYYVVAKLKAGTVVEVDDVISGWSKITPPANCYSFVSKAFVNAKGDGKTGKVSSDRVPVKAASIQGVPGESYHRQLYLFKGDTVEIVSEEGSFYKIIPPKGVHVYLPPDTVKPVGTEDVKDQAAAATIAVVVAEEAKDESPVPDDAQQMEAEAVEPEAAEGEVAVEEQAAEDGATEEAAAVTASGTTAAAVRRESDAKAAEGSSADDGEAQAAESEGAQKTETVTDAVAEETAAEEAVVVAQADDAVVDVTDDEEVLPVRQEIAQAEVVMVEAMAQPLEEQPLDDLEGMYQELDAIEDLNEHEQQMVDNRLIQISRNRELLAAVMLIQEPAAVQQEEKGYPEFDFRGILTGSGVYDGDARTLLYRLIDEDTGRTLGYIRPNAGIDIYQAMGREVGVFGTAAIDIETNVKMLVIDSYEIIDSQK